ncbi:MAG: hypothetical protein FJ087_22920 [Deltaproteobacteria bacterium]|nr:hypothetical protein [Deltaproteobacteria bacterium]
MTNVELGAKVSFKLVSWASLDYEFRALRVPQVTDEFQLQNMLPLNFSYTRTWTPEPPPSPASAATP